MGEKRENIAIAITDLQAPESTQPEEADESHRRSRRRRSAESNGHGTAPALPAGERCQEGSADAHADEGNHLRPRRPAARARRVHARRRRTRQRRERQRIGGRLEEGRPRQATPGRGLADGGEGGAGQARSLPGRIPRQPDPHDAGDRQTGAHPDDFERPEPGIPNAPHADPSAKWGRSGPRSASTCKPKAASPATSCKTCPPERLLTRFPDRLDTTKKVIADTPEGKLAKYYNLDEYDLIIAFDFDWNERDKSQPVPHFRADDQERRNVGEQSRRRFLGRRRAAAHVPIRPHQKRTAG